MVIPDRSADHLSVLHRTLPLPHQAPPVPSASGAFSNASSSRLVVLNGSHNSISDDPEHHSVIVFPDYVVVSNVAASSEGAAAFWKYALSHEITVPAGTSSEEPKTINGISEHIRYHIIALSPYVSPPVSFIQEMLECYR